MIHGQRTLAAHYAATDLGRRILDALAAEGKDIDHLHVDDLAPVDAFHIRGRAATEELARHARMTRDDMVLDVGCGLGGTSRYLAATVGCRVVGIDLTKEFCEIARMLSDRVGMSDRTQFRQSSALELPAEDSSFDVVWTEHVQMNIEDKARFYGEIARVLRPGGQFAFHDILSGAAGEPYYPVPWASDASISHLIGVDALRTLLADLGFQTIHFGDTSLASAAFFREVLERVWIEGWKPLGLHILMGENATEKFSNLLRSLEEDRVRVVQGVMSLGPPSASRQNG